MAEGFFFFVCTGTLKSNQNNLPPTGLSGHIHVCPCMA